MKINQKIVSIRIEVSQKDSSNTLRNFDFGEDQKFKKQNRESTKGYSRWKVE